MQSKGVYVSIGFKTSTSNDGKLCICNGTPSLLSYIARFL
jgi:hypothetical protein